MSFPNGELRMDRDETREFTTNEVLPEANERDPAGSISRVLRDQPADRLFDRGVDG